MAKDVRNCFAKIVQVDGHQVLFYLEPDDEHDDRERMNQIVRINGMCVNVALGGLTYENADKLLADTDEGRALIVLDAIRDMIAPQVKETTP